MQALSDGTGDIFVTDLGTAIVAELLQFGTMQRPKWHSSRRSSAFTCLTHLLRA